MGSVKQSTIPKRARRTAKLDIRALPAALARWRHAAAAAGVSLTEWVEHHLDRACGAAQDQEQSNARETIED